MKILVAIANHGTKNRHFLDQLIAAYHEMRHEVTIVVLSDKPKDDLPADVEVLVGAPTSNPWSLPFAHRALFSERAQDFDLFIYSEDDTLIEQRHVDAFLQMNAVLPDDEIPGFMRYENRPSGERSYCSVHSYYRWDTESVRKHGGEVFASFTNAHSACFILTREQLLKAIDSGGFLIPPHEGVYDMLVSAATDPYTRCGLKRRIPISRIDDFLLHHLPNVYLDKLGIGPEDFNSQLEALMDIAEGRLSAGLLVDPGARLLIAPWSMQCYPRAFDALRECLQDEPNKVLSIGTTSGMLEREMFGETTKVVGIPVDNALGAMARSRNIDVTPPVWAEAMQQVHGQTFDVVLLHDVLHRFPQPERILRDLKDCLTEGSHIVITMPNFWHYRLRKAIRGQPSELPFSYSGSGMHQPTWRNLMAWLRDSGLRLDGYAFETSRKTALLSKLSGRLGGTWLGRQLVVRAGCG